MSDQGKHKLILYNVLGGYRAYINTRVQNYRDRHAESEVRALSTSIQLLLKFCKSSLSTCIQLLLKSKTPLSTCVQLQLQIQLALEANEDKQESNTILDTPEGATDYTSPSVPLPQPTGK